jgi:hypothetical protein
MSDWKEELITDCLELQRGSAALVQAREEDQEIKNVKSTMKKVATKITELEKPYTDKIAALTLDIEKIHETLIRDWDITEKTCEYDIGTATLRIKKSLNINDKKQLITILLNIGKLPEAIRSWNLSYLRKLKDVDMIDDTIAHYDEHQNVIIKEVR